MSDTHKVMTSVGWVFESVKTASSGLLSIAESKNCQFINSHSSVGSTHQGEITGWYRVDLIQILRIVHLVLLWTVSSFSSQPHCNILYFNCCWFELPRRWWAIYKMSHLFGLARKPERQGAKHTSRDFCGCQCAVLCVICMVLLCCKLLGFLFLKVEFCSLLMWFLYWKIQETEITSHILCSCYAQQQVQTKLQENASSRVFVYIFIYIYSLTIFWCSRRGDKP